VKLPAILDISHELYHQDRLGLDVPTLSRSVAEILTTQSPLHAYRAHPKLGGKGGKKSTKDMDNGSVLHDYFLGSGPEIVVVDAPDWRKRKEFDPGPIRKEIEAAGKIAMLPKEVEELKRDRATIQEALDRRFGGWEKYIEKRRRESTLVWEEEGVVWRIRLDLYEQSIGEAEDLKFTYSADDEAIVRKMRRENAAFQAACYVAGMNAMFPELAGRNMLRFLYIEFSGADCRFGRPSQALISMAEDQRQRAMKKWRTCLERNEWPGYPDRELVVEPASWQLAAALDKELSEGGDEPEWLKDV
jgi:hypothetical protein